VRTVTIVTAVTKNLHYPPRLSHHRHPEKMRVCPHHTLKAAVAGGLIPRNAAAGLKLPRITREEIDP
jgi:hypothetical protein